MSEQGDISRFLKEEELLWYQLRKWVKLKMGMRPDLNAMLFLIGINELGQIKETYSKEEKQDLMHIAICRLMEPEGYFRFLGKDEEGWPHYEALKPMPKTNLKEQEKFLKSRIVRYFETEIDEWK
jgi:hypothetical protein